MDHTRRCQRCHRPLPCTARSDARYCSGYCRVAAHRARHTADAASVVPAELRGRDRWVRHDRKRPITVTGRAASSTDPRTWATYAAAHASTVGDGLGFILDGDGIACMDLDDCLTDAGGVMPWAAGIVDALPRTFVEVSPSGTGLHVWGFAKLPHGRVVHVEGGGKVEVYGSARYLTLTGQRFAGAPSTLAPIGDLIAQVTHH